MLPHNHKTWTDAYEQAEHVHKQDLQLLLLPQTASLEINNAVVLKAYLQLDNWQAACKPI